MHTTPLWTFALLAVLTLVPTVAADEAAPAPDGAPATDPAAAPGPCDLLWYTLDPPNVQVDPSCLPPLWLPDL